MEEGLYEVDVHSLKVNTLMEDKLFSDEQILPGRHGKGAYTGQGRLIYSNNGVGGVLAEWYGKDDPKIVENWTIIDNNKYTEITSSGGIYGSPNDSSVIWSLGWDDKSVLLRVCDNGKWYRFRLPKASYTYDADHGWYTEWPRIRAIGRKKLLMDMHGMFYEIPESFNAGNIAGIYPVARHLRMVVDFCEWKGNLVMASDDASVMQNPYLGRSQSNLWFGKFDDLLKMGKPSGWGGVWNKENVKAGEPSEAFLCSGFDRRVLHISHDSEYSLEFTVEIERSGTGTWESYKIISVPAKGYKYHILQEKLKANWIRLVPNDNVDSVTAYYHYSNSSNTYTDSKIARSLTKPNEGKAYSVGLLYPNDNDSLTLGMAADYIDSEGNITESGYYEIGSDMKLKYMECALEDQEIRSNLRINNEFQIDAASVILQDAEGKRYRIPKGLDSFTNLRNRCIREVVTERYLMNVNGSFYELPRQASEGLYRIKPICTHNRIVHDFASWRGMLVISGTNFNEIQDEHYVCSDDGKVGLWFGNVDDLWSMGEPKGEGGPCIDMPLRANQPTDPYLMTGYEEKSVKLSHNCTEPVEFTIEVDYMANNTWHVYDKIMVNCGSVVEHTFPVGYNAHWVRIRINKDCKATAWFTYN
jgi:hypothetical protein